MQIDQTEGRLIEGPLGRQLSERYPVVPLSDLPGRNGRGPRTLARDGGVRVPDFMVPAHDWALLEIKLKSTHGTFHNWDHRPEQGIDYDAWRDYRAFETQFRRRMVLMILEKSSGDVLGATLDDLAVLGRPRKGIWNDGTPSINWDRRAFLKVGTFDLPDGPESLAVAFDWQALDRLVRQAVLPYESEVTR